MNKVDMIKLMQRIKRSGEWTRMGQKAKIMVEFIRSHEGAVLPTDPVELANLEATISFMLATGKALYRTRYILIGVGLGLGIAYIARKEENKNANRVRTSAVPEKNS